MENNSFSRIRHGIKDHIYSGQLKGGGCELSVYMALHLHADFDTGVCYKISSPFISNFLHCKTHTVNRSLVSLEKKGYIKRLKHRGQMTYYPIVINKYETIKGLIIRADKTLSLNEIAFEVQVNCNLSVNQVQVNCKSNVIQVLTIQELKKIEIIRVKEAKPRVIVEWKEDFEVYKKLAKDNFRIIADDLEYIKVREEYHPNLDIKKTMEKSFVDFWGIEKGWNHCKKKKGEINWKSTVNNLLTQKSNQVWKPRDFNNQSPTFKRTPDDYHVAPKPLPPEERISLEEVKNLYKPKEIK